MTKTSSKSQIAYESIKERITTGRFTPGYRLVLASIATELGVSVVPVREAIRRLEAEGLVTFERNVGAQVAMVDEREYLYTMQTVALVEGYATALSAPLLDAGRLDRARQVNENLSESLANFEPRVVTRLNLEFHAVLFELCPNPYILLIVHRAWDRMSSLRDSTFSFVPGRVSESLVEHEQLLQLIEQGADSDAIEQFVRMHRTRTLEAFLAYQGEHLIDQV